MLFSSLDFLIFFLAYFGLHLITPYNYRIYLIICGSSIFYAWWKIEYIWLPYFLMAIAYGGMRWIERAPSTWKRRARFVATLIVLFLPLVIFKYTNFFYQDVLGPIFGWQGHLLDVPLPLGVSFVTFTLTAFVVDIVNGKFPSTKHPSTVLAYILFFPHLIAGPILRPAELIPQLESPRRSILPVAAIAIFSIGLIKKLVFADSIAAVVDAAYAKDALSSPEALLAIYGFSAQIYCDFSGYTDMAIGLAMLLGVRLPNNFSRPYAAVSLIDFWRRWHITLSHWLRDYLYIPIGGSRYGLPNQLRNIVVTMVLGGLWHGANWTFVVWGFLHGIGLSVVHIIRKFTGISSTTLIQRWVGVILTFHFVTFAWIFFRSPNLSKAFNVLGSVVLGGWVGSSASYHTWLFSVVLMILVFSLFIGSTITGVFGLRCGVFRCR